MNYILTLLSSGRPVYLERTLSSYAEFLSPAPTRVFVFDDGNTTPNVEALVLAAFEETVETINVQSRPTRLGQCAAQEHCWQAAAGSPCDWAFHVEDDVVLLRPTSLGDLAYVLDAEPTLAQMALVRCPWGAEIEFGGYIPKDPGWYERHESNRDYEGYCFYEWMTTTRNWAHSPALFRTSLCREFPFPAEAGCETTIGPMIRETHPDAAFGLWGAGEPWVAHVGVERAAGSHGY